MRDVCACGGGGPWPHGDILMVERPFTHKMPFMSSIFFSNEICLRYYPKIYIYNQ